MIEKARTVVNKETLSAVRYLCSADTARASLTQVRVSPLHVEATNGHALVRRLRNTPDTGQAADIFVPASIAARVAALGGKQVTTVEIARLAETSQEYAPETCRVEAAGDTLSASIDAAFPDTDAVISDALVRCAGPNVVRLSLNPELLLAAAKALGWEPAKKGRSALGVVLTIALPAAREPGNESPAPTGIETPFIVRRTLDSEDLAIVMPFQI